MFSKLSPLITLALCGFLVSLVSFGLWLNANKLQERLIFGEVVTVEGNTLIIENKHKDTTTVTLTGTTTIMREKSVLRSVDLTAGMFVQIVGQRSGGDEVVAQTIRIMRPPKAERNYEPERD